MPSSNAVKKIPEACIRQEHQFTWCGREAYNNEYLFNDAAHAVKHYTNGTSLRACQYCVERAAPKVTMGHDSPLATRGLNDR